MNATAQFTYGWADVYEGLRGKRGKEPAHIVVLRDKVRQIEKEILDLIDRVEENGDPNDPCRWKGLHALDIELDHAEYKLNKALTYWHDTGDWDPEIPF